MSTSLLYHTCGIRGYEYRSTEYLCGTMIVRIEQSRGKLRCPRCGRRDVTMRGGVLRMFRSVPIGSKPVSIALNVPRVYCPKCAVTRQVPIGFAREPKGPSMFGPIDLGWLIRRGRPLRRSRATHR